jgi:hypothetical protein
MVWEDVVYPSQAEAYEKATKMQMELFAAQDFPQWVGVFSNNDFTYSWLYEIDSYADIDTLYQEFAKIYENATEKVKEIEQAFEGTHESTKTWTFFWDRDLSYNPDIPEGSTLEGNFRYWGHCYVVKGKMDEMRKVFKGWVDLATRKNGTQGFNTYIGDMGVEAPHIFWVSQAKGPADFFIANAQNMELFGEEADVLWGKQMKLLRKFKESTGWYREDLSYSPAE